MTSPPFASPYIPNTDADRAAMLRAVGAASVDDLFGDIPAEHRDPALDLPPPLSEMELRAEIERMAATNLHGGDRPSFLGAGVYRRFIPAVVPPIVTRGEFLTSYTPYQPEVSQGTLQGSFEFQTMTAQLFGMEAANAGMYDGATSLAEAALMACRVTRRYRVAVAHTVNPRYVETARTYAAPQGVEIVDVAASAPALDDDIACLIVQYPNFFGCVEDLHAQREAARAVGALFVVSADPVACGLFKSPGAYGADIVTGEGQALGVPPSFGGPFVGLFACKQDYLRQTPGRIVGKTTDTRGREGYVLTMQPREQHIRRERATSNICTSTALIALWATVWTACMGKQGLRRLAELCHQKAHYAASRVAELPGYSLPIEGEFFQEFVVSCPRPPVEVNARLEANGVIGGLDVSDRYRNGMLLCVTETATRGDIDRLVELLAEAA
ncbi:MAG: aminomethyl-transferring glycine dehydrogenase subunit GcvPA [Dehalococcoidia bacterium]|nr:aminomethyl-transferring glycine dehydrogenase subunit GcvPA [Dehalococcoidia bacterium]